MKYEIQGITSDVYQTFDIDIPNKSEKVFFTLRYLPTQMAWYMNFEYGNVKVNGLKLTLSPNLLRSYRNIIPFGLSVFSEDSVYPLEVDAFETERVKIYILAEDYVNNLEESLYAR